MKCWHCQAADGTTGFCDCFTCYKETVGAILAGPCKACAARAKLEKMRPMLDTIDPRDPKYWRLEKQVTGGFHRVFIPEEQWDAKKSAS